MLTFRLISVPQLQGIRTGDDSLVSRNHEDEDCTAEHCVFDEAWDLPTVIISLGIQPFAPILSLYRATPRRPPGRRLKRRAFPGIIAILSGRPKGFGIVWSRPQQKLDPSGL